jgi:hypothetical protein
MRLNKLLQRLVVCLLGFTLSTTACNPRSFGTPESVLEKEIPQNQFSVLPPKTPIPTSLFSQNGSAYLILTTSEAPYLHRLIHVPTSCLLALIDCSTPVVVTAYPEVGVTPSHLHWKPNFQEALILDSYEPRILSFDPKSASITTIVKDIPTIRDDLIWLTDNLAIFVVQDSADYASKLVSLNWESGEPEIQSLADFGGIAYLLGIDVLGRILVSLEIYDYPKGVSSFKKEVVSVHLLAINQVTGVVTEPWEQIDWLSERPQSLLPDGRHLVVGSSSLALWDLQDEGRKVRIGDNAVFPVGSPDKRWLAWVEKGYNGDPSTIRLYNIDTGDRFALVKLPLPPKLFWASNSKYIVMTLRGTEANLGTLLVVSLGDGSMLSSPINLGNYSLVEDVSWGP